MSSVLQLECFDSPGRVSVKALAATEPEGYQDGYIAGVTATEATMAAAQDHLREDLVAAIQAASATFADAQEQLLATMTPLLDAMLTTVLPAALEPALWARLRALVTQALVEDSQAQLTLRVSPDHTSTVQAALSDFSDAPVTIEAAPELDGAAAWVVTPKGETALDMQAVLGVIAEHVRALNAAPTGEVRHG